VLREHLHHAAVGGEVVVLGQDLGDVAAVRDLETSCQRLELFSSGLKSRKFR